MFGLNPSAIAEAMEQIKQARDVFSEIARDVRELREDQATQLDELKKMRAEIQRLIDEVQ